MLSLGVLLATGCMAVLPVSETGRGCKGEAADFFPARQVVERRAMAELRCESGVGVEQRSDIEFTATGCGRTRRYLCEADAVSGCSLQDAASRDGCQALWTSAAR